MAPTFKIQAYGKIKRIIVRYNGCDWRLSQLSALHGVSARVIYERLLSGSDVDTAIRHTPEDLERMSAPAWEGAATRRYRQDPVAQILLNARGSQGYTLEEIGVMMGVSHEAIRKEIERALAKLKRSPELYQQFLQSLDTQARKNMTIYPASCGRL